MVVMTNGVGGEHERSHRGIDRKRRPRIQGCTHVRKGRLRDHRLENLCLSVPSHPRHVMKPRNLGNAQVVMLLTRCAP